MKTPEQIRNMEFQKSPMGGYKQSDVELFLEEIASEVEILTRQKADADRKLQEYTKKAPEGGLSAAGIENILVNAQLTADAMIEAAKEQAASIIAEAELNVKQAEIKARDIIADAENKAVLLGEAAEKEAQKIIAEGIAKAEEAVTSAKESIDLEQKLYDRLIIEVSDYRKKAVAQCSAVLELINQLPSEVPFNMERAKTVLAIDFNNPEELLHAAVNEKLASAKAEEMLIAQREAEEKARLEEEAKRIAEEKAAKEAEEKALREAEEKALREAEERAKAEAEEKARLEAEALQKAQEKENDDNLQSAAIEPAEIEEAQSVSEEAEEEPKKEEAVEAYDDEAIPVISNIRSDVKEDAVANMQLIFEDEIEEKPKKNVVTKTDVPKAKGRISFGVDDEDDYDEDDEPRLFFRRKKK